MPDKKLKMKIVCEGLQIQHGEDGHWLCFKQGNRHGIINIENVLTTGSIAQTVILDWIDAHLVENKMKKNDLSNCKVGDIVWTIREGWTTLIEVFSHNGAVVKVITDITSSDVNGLENETDKYPMIYLEPPEGFNAEPKPCEFKKGDRVLVSNKGVIYARRYFRAIHSKTYETFADGSDEWSCEDGNLEYWKYCKKWEEGEDE